MQTLPFLLSSFIGRKREVTEVVELIEQHRLVTLTGFGGIGKTRLAFEVAGNVVEAYEANIILVDLSTIQDASLIPQTIIAACGLREQHGLTPQAHLIQHFQSKSALLILDNCEHLIEGCASIVFQLLTATPDLHILATSREPLGLSGEMIWQVPSLTIPELDTLLSIESIASADAVQLLEQRAVDALSHFQLTEQNIAAVTQICRHLDGIPLAIEMVAAQVQVLSPEQILERLEADIAILRSADRTAPNRQQTLQATIDWSFNLLSEQERRLFVRVSVFVSGFTLEALEQVCTDEALTESEVLPLLSNLIRKSLVVVSEQGAGTRYRLLETVRQYADAKLRNIDDDAVLKERLAQYISQFVNAAEPHLKTSRRSQWLDHLEAEIGNIRAVMQWSRSQEAQDIEAILLGQLTWFWHFRGYLREGLERADDWLNRMEAAPDSKHKSDVLWVAGATQWVLGDHEASRQHLGAAVAIARKFQTKPRLAYALTLLGLMTGLQGNQSDALHYFEECLSLFKEIDDQWGLALTYYWLADTYRIFQDYPQARIDYEQSLVIFRQIDDKWGISLPLQGLGAVDLHFGAFTSARRWLDECLALRRLSEDEWLIAQTLATLAPVAMAQSDLKQAVVYLEETLALYQKTGDRLGIMYALRSVGYVRLALNEAALALADFREGLVLSQENHHQKRAMECLVGILAVIAPYESPEDIVRLLSFVSTTMQKEGLQFSPEIEATYQQVHQQYQDQLDSATWRQSSILSPEHALNLALSLQISSIPKIQQTTQPLLRILALGRSEVYQDDSLLTSTDWKYAKVRQLFFYVLNHDAVTKEDIGLVLWPDASPAQLRSAFHDTMYHLRRVLDRRDWVVYENKHYSFNRSLDYIYDVERFEQLIHDAQRQQPHIASTSLQEAVELYQGDFLGDNLDSDWHLPKQETLRRTYIDSLLSLGAIHFENADYSAALETYFRVVDVDNLLETAHRELMRCYGKMGEVAQALRHYKNLVILLRDELGSPPDPQTQTLYEELHRGKIR